jgi:thioredoxin-dependent peroxiredoxin
MQGILTFCTTLGLAAVALAAVQSQPPAELKVGDPAPAFTLPGSDGKSYTLDEFKGKKPVVLAWYPKAFTGG